MKSKVIATVGSTTPVNPKKMIVTVSGQELTHSRHRAAAVIAACMQRASYIILHSISTSNNLCDPAVSRL